MGDNGAKLVIDKEFMQFELNLQNNYKDLAFQNYTKVHELLDGVYEQGGIAKWYYGRMKKRLKKYDEIYHPEEEDEEK